MAITHTSFNGDRGRFPYLLICPIQAWHMSRRKHQQPRLGVSILTHQAKNLKPRMLGFHHQGTFELVQPSDHLRQITWSVGCALWLMAPRESSALSSGIHHHDWLQPSWASKAQAFLHHMVYDDLPLLLIECHHIAALSVREMVPDALSSVHFHCRICPL